MHKVRNLGATVVLLFALASCTADANTAEGTAGVGEIAGFWLGLWHGLIFPIAFIVSLFDQTISFYEIHNTGGTYDLGFVAGGFFFGLAIAALKNEFFPKPQRF